MKSSFARMRKDFYPLEIITGFYIYLVNPLKDPPRAIHRIYSIFRLAFVCIFISHHMQVATCCIKLINSPGRGGEKLIITYNPNCSHPPLPLIAFSLPFMREAL